MTFTKLEEHISFFWFRLIRLAIVLIVWIHISGGWFYVLAVYYLNHENTWIGAIMGSDFPLKIKSFYVADDVFFQNETSTNLCILVECIVDILNNGEVVKVEHVGDVLGAYGSLLDIDEV
ncbi:hypothetical protein ACFE04_002937 [Oxalis oulophora]